jgi:hypothetical protein
MGRVVALKGKRIVLTFEYNRELIDELKGLKLGARWIADERVWQLEQSLAIAQGVEPLLRRWQFVKAPDYIEWLCNGQARLAKLSTHLEKVGLDVCLRVYEARGLIPRKYQITAAAEALKRLGRFGYVGLFLDVGLGKTVLSLALAATLRIEEEDPIVVVAPLSLVRYWQQEIAACGLRNTQVYSYSEAQKKRPSVLPRKAIMIVDESNFIKDGRTSRSKWVGKGVGQAHAVMFLTATPMPNATAMEVWYLVAEVWSDLKLKQVVNHLGARYWVDEIRTRQRGLVRVLRVSMPDPKQLEEYAVCMTQEAVGSELPPLVEEILAVGEDTAPIEARAMEEARQEGKVSLFRFLRLLEAGLAELIDRQLDAFAKPYLLFYKHQEAGRRLAARLGVPRLGGEHEGKERERVVKAFQEGGKGLILQHQVGKFGLNLQQAQNVIFTMLPWTWDDYYQMVGRARREGQSKTVIAYRMSSAVLDDLWELVSGKRLGRDVIVELAERISARYGVTCTTVLVKEEQET